MYVRSAFCIIQMKAIAVVLCRALLNVVQHRLASKSGSQTLIAISHIRVLLKCLELFLYFACDI